MQHTCIGAVPCNGNGISIFQGKSACYRVSFSFKFVGKTRASNLVVDCESQMKVPEDIVSAAYLIWAWFSSEMLNAVFSCY